MRKIERNGRFPAKMYKYLYMVELTARALSDTTSQSVHKRPSTKREVERAVIRERAQLHRATTAREEDLATDAA